MSIILIWKQNLVMRGTKVQTVGGTFSWITVGIYFIPKSKVFSVLSATLRESRICRFYTKSRWIPDNHVPDIISGMTKGYNQFRFSPCPKPVTLKA